MAPSLPRVNVAALRDVFKSLDKDGDGYLTVTDLQAAPAFGPTAMTDASAARPVSWVSGFWVRSFCDGATNGYRVPL